MRIISGEYKSRKIFTPSLSESGTSKLRPTSDRARETLFDVLHNRIDFSGASCLDLFAGTGSFGFECISRGASTCEFVDKSRKSGELIQKTASSLGCEEQVNFYRTDALTFLNGEPDKGYDLIFADPPYDYGKFIDLSKAVLAREFGTFILESGKNISFSIDDVRFNMIDKKVGNTYFKIFSPAE